MELVSIVIPTYKGASTICNAVDSALCQDYKNIEIIVVDDNGANTESQIATENVMQKYKNNKKVIYNIHQKNVNGSAARNTGARLAKGNYIALLDDDDVFLPMKISKQLKSFESKSEEYAVSYTSYENIFNNGRKRVTKAIKEGDLCYELLSMQLSVLSSVLMVRKDAWIDVGGFDESFKRDQDQEFCVRLFKKYKVAVVHDVCMIRYILQRNVPQSVEKGVEYREYYLSRMKNVISTFSRKQQKLIYSANFIEIAKRYLKAKKPIKCLKYIIKSKTPLKATYSFLVDFINYQKNLNKNSHNSINLKIEE